jgi:hypothetical protein
VKQEVCGQKNCNLNRQIKKKKTFEAAAAAPAAFVISRVPASPLVRSYCMLYPECCEVYLYEV